MEEELLISSTMTKSEASDSNSCSNSPQKKSKPSSKYKGVVPQANGNWGAQIYASHHRIWLGTFITEDLAGAAYDSAAIKLRHSNSADPHRNFPLNDMTIHEPAFQEIYSTDQILNMIKDGSYQTKFLEFLSMSNGDGSQANIIYNNSDSKRGGYVPKELFRKELTPSDVGKLNRLVIPKRYALKFFNPDELGNGGELELTFFDNLRRSWKFRYCYWQSSSSFVFTRGWNGFVKDKDLKANDIVVFYELSENINGNDAVRKIYSIDIVRSNTSEVRDEVTSRKRDSEEEVAGDELPLKMARLEETTIVNKEKSFRLFGKDIIPGNCNVE